MVDWSVLDPVPDIPRDMRMEIGMRKRERGNSHFSRGDYSNAIQCYRYSAVCPMKIIEIYSQLPLTMNDLVFPYIEFKCLFVDQGYLESVKLVLVQLLPVPT